MKESLKYFISVFALTCATISIFTFLLITSSILFSVISAIGLTGLVYFVSDYIRVINENNNLKTQISA